MRLMRIFASNWNEAKLSGERRAAGEKRWRELGRNECPTS
jgi:hypothetical protein